MSDDEIYSTTVRTVLGSSRREHRWDLAHEVSVFTVLGKSFFDLRQARPLSDEDCEVSIRCFLGSVELLVPVGTRVTLEGSTFLAGASSDVSGDGDTEAPGDGVDLALDRLPRLDIAATAVLGRVRVRTPDRPLRARPPRFARLRRKKTRPVDSVPAPSITHVPATSDPVASRTPQPQPRPPQSRTPQPRPDRIPAGSQGIPSTVDTGPLDIGSVHVSIEPSRRSNDEPAPAPDDFEAADFPG